MIIKLFAALTLCTVEAQAGIDQDLLGTQHIAGKLSQHVLHIVFGYLYIILISIKLEQNTGIHVGKVRGSESIIEKHSKVKMKPARSSLHTLASKFLPIEGKTEI